MLTIAHYGTPRLVLVVRHRNPREDGFDITVASELMAILTLSHNLDDMKQRISRIMIGYTYDKEPVTVADLGVEVQLRRY